MITINTVKLFATDYDGTIAQNDGQVAIPEINLLKHLGEKGIVRVVVTGRSLFSSYEVMKSEFPIDYLVFSSGIGVVNWKTREIIHQNELDVIKAKRVIDVLLKNNLDFMVHHPSPNNHHFHYHKGGEGNPDFERRISRYKNYAIPFSEQNNEQRISQLIIILENDGVYWIEYLRKEFPDLNIVRTTSPLDHKSIWIEVFPKNVSKAEGLKFLSNKLNIVENDILCVGNDYNDLDMLNFAGHAFVVANAPEDMKSEFSCIKSNSENGVANIFNGKL